MKCTNVGAGTPHTVSSITGAFESTPDLHFPFPEQFVKVAFGHGGFSLAGQAFSYRSTTPGEVSYFCKIRPQMSGKIIVADNEVPLGAVQFINAGWGSETTSVDAFGPSVVTIAKGTTVIWAHIGVYEPHTVTSGTFPVPNGVFDSSLNMNEDFNKQLEQVEFVNRGQSFEHTFNEVGTFPYFCKLHLGIRGTVTVLPQSENSTSNSTMFGLTIGALMLAVVSLGISSVTMRRKA